MRSTPCGPRSTRCASAMKPSSLRMLVSMSAIVSVITPPITASSPGSPAGLDHAGDLAPVRQLPQADAAEAELAKDRPRPAAAETPRIGAHLELGGPLPLLQQRLLGHPRSSRLTPRIRWRVFAGPPRLSLAHPFGRTTRPAPPPAAGGRAAAAVRGPPRPCGRWSRW